MFICIGVQVFLIYIYIETYIYIYLIYTYDIYMYIFKYSTHKIPTFSIQSPSSQGADQRIEFGLSQWIVRRLQQQMGRDRGPNLRGLTGKFPEVKRDKYLVLNVAVCLLVFLFSVFFPVVLHSWQNDQE